MMETRMILEGKVYVLWMNRMTERGEDSTPVAVATDLQTLIDWYTSQYCDRYTDDGRWNKSFRKDSALEWFNPISTFAVNPTTFFHHGIFTEWIRVNTDLHPINLNPNVIWLG